MIIIAGSYAVDAAERDDVVDAFRDMVTRARGFDGCLHLAVTADSVEPDRVQNLEVWRDADALDAWRGQADPPDTPEPRDADVRRYDAEDGGPLF